MGYFLGANEIDALLFDLSKRFRVYAPKRFPKEGRYSGTDLVRYAEVHRFADIEWRQKSDFSMKDVLTPIQQTLFYFTEDEFRESKGPDKPMLIFAHACDLNAQKVQDEMYLMNGGNIDPFYKRARDLARFVLMDCGGGDDTCFCVSMGTNKADNYAMAVKFFEKGMQCKVVDKDLDGYFEKYHRQDYEPSFVTENELKVTHPDIKSDTELLALKKHEMWLEYNHRCISCGACTVCCPTCTCFKARDVIWGDNPSVGERRRVEQSCEVPGYDQMAMQREMRPDPASRMRYKVLHKFHEHKARFGHQMCVGCGRCIHRCPEFISIAATVGKINHALEDIRQKEAAQ